MINLLSILKHRNEALFYFGLICLLCSLLFISLTKLSQLQVKGANAWYKPLKFALSIGVFCWTMGWFTGYLKEPEQIWWYNCSTIVLLGFELFYITFQAARGQLSHFNQSAPLYVALYAAMGLAITAATLYTAYIGVLFCTSNFPELPDYYLWSIRLGIFLFVIFAFVGAIMGARLSHTSGGVDDGPGLPMLGWSRKFGDLRIAHFVGMHALQILPLLSFYILKNVTLTFLAGAIYGTIALLILVQALRGRPLVR
jgi:hypothetical protein